MKVKLIWWQRRATVCRLKYVRPEGLQIRIEQKKHFQTFEAGRMHTIFRPPQTGVDRPLQYRTIKTIKICIAKVHIVKKLFFISYLFSCLTFNVIISTLITLHKIKNTTPFHQNLHLLII